MFQCVCLPEGCELSCDAAVPHRGDETKHEVGMKRGKECPIRVGQQ